VDHHHIDCTQVLLQTVAFDYLLYARLDQFDLLGVLLEHLVLIRRDNFLSDESSHNECFKGSVDKLEFTAR
jgi:hypothetical protein